MGYFEAISGLVLQIAKAKHSGRTSLKIHNVNISEALTPTLSPRAFSSTGSCKSRSFILLNRPSQNSEAFHGKAGSGSVGQQIIDLRDSFIYIKGSEYVIMRIARILPNRRILPSTDRWDYFRAEKKTIVDVNRCNFFSMHERRGKTI
jgi:hypothetical protein